ncbi:MAG: hypothetical protein WC455_21940 [Dehalococcoidia bacterium]
MITSDNEKLEHDFVIKRYPHIEHFLKRKSGGARVVCETILKCLPDPTKDENYGWVLSIELFEKCANFNPRTIADQLKDLQTGYIIDKCKYVAHPKRKRPGPAKKRESVFYRLIVPGYAHTVEEKYNELIEQYNQIVEIPLKYTIAIEMLNWVKSRYPEFFNDLGVEGPEDYIEQVQNDRQKTKEMQFIERYLQRQSDKDPRYLTTEDVLLSVLAVRSKKNAALSQERKEQKDDEDLAKAKERKECRVNFEKRYF